MLKRQLAKAAQQGFTFYTHPEIEFFLFNETPDEGRDPVPVDNVGYFDHSPHPAGQDFRRQAISTLEHMGISVEFSHHEGGPGQQEIDLRYADALTTADNIMTFRLVVRRSRSNTGGGRIVHAQAIHRAPRFRHAHAREPVRRRRQRLLRAGAEFQLSPLARQFIAGLLHHAPEITAVTNQWINSTSVWLAG